MEVSFGPGNGYTEGKNVLENSQKSTANYGTSRPPDVSLHVYFAGLFLVLGDNRNRCSVSVPRAWAPSGEQDRLMWG